jgi:hypothetical protein
MVAPVAGSVAMRRVQLCREGCEQRVDAGYGRDAACGVPEVGLSS